MKPALHHADTVFHDVRLTTVEATQIAAYIRSKQPAAATLSGQGNAVAGERVVATSCIVCHETGAPAGSRRYADAPSLEEMARGDWTVKGCLAENRGRAPDLRLAPDHVAALIAFRNADRDVGMGSLRRFAPTEYVASQMKALNCAYCHSGGAENKLPDISYAGEKLDHGWLTDLIAGRHPNRIRPWMEARMPAFASRAANLALGLAAKHGVPLKTEGPATPSSPELVALGSRIAGTDGYSCVACHDAGSRKALQVFEGQGPNLSHAPERLRYDYYLRWMHWPQRIASTTIMPRYTKDRDRALLDTHLDGQAGKQFEAVWQWAQSLKTGGQ
jgi:mono/diheme cytochrome c family protein